MTITKLLESLNGVNILQVYTWAIQLLGVTEKEPVEVISAKHDTKAIYVEVLCKGTSHKLKLEKDLQKKIECTLENTNSLGFCNGYPTKEKPYGLYLEDVWKTTKFNTLQRDNLLNKIRVEIPVEKSLVIFYSRNLDSRHSRELIKEFETTGVTLIEAYPNTSFCDVYLNGIVSTGYKVYPGKTLKELKRLFPKAEFKRFDYAEVYKVVYEE